MTNAEKRGTRLEMEYEDAPSGTVLLYNYKEPFMRFEQGYGYEGVLLFDSNDEKVQCHLCGNWFAYLPNHLRKEYNMNASAYKEMVGLSQTTALIGEKQRAVLIANGLARRILNVQGLTRKGTHRSEETKRKISETLKNVTRERQNRLGTCPAQLIERLRQEYHRTGKTPGKNYGPKDTCIRVFGTWEEACNRAGIPYVAPGGGFRKGKIYEKKYTKSEIVLWIRDNVIDGKLPTQRAYARHIKATSSTISYTARKFGGWDALCHEALVSAGEIGGYKKIRGHRYSPAELLELLVNFAKHNKRNPSVSDCKRGLLPHASRYIYHWGGWRQALKAAGL